MEQEVRTSSPLLPLKPLSAAATSLVAFEVWAVAVLVYTMDKHLNVYIPSMEGSQEPLQGFDSCHTSVDLTKAHLRY